MSLICALGPAETVFCALLLSWEDTIGGGGAGVKLTYAVNALVTLSCAFEARHDCLFSQWHGTYKCLAHTPTLVPSCASLPILLCWALYFTTCARRP